MSAYVPGSEIRSIVLDCDGIILESVECKHDAFLRLFLDEPEHLSEIKAYRYANAGVSRYQQFDEIYSKILRRPLDVAERVALGDRFSEYVAEGLLSCDLVPGVRELLELSVPHIPLYVASASPQLELQDTLSRRSLAQYFRQICGYPTSKVDTICLAAQVENIAAAQILFVGDAAADFAASEETGCQFIGRQLDGRPAVFGETVRVVPDCHPVAVWVSLSLTSASRNRG